MYCPRCGAQNPDDSKYCSSCGVELRPAVDPATKEARTPHSSLGDLLGRTRRARLLTLGTLAALIIAVIAFVVIPPDEESEQTIPRDAYTRAADQICLAQKQAIISAGGKALASRGTNQLGAYAAVLVPITIEWRSQMAGLSAPADRVGLAEELSSALRNVAVRAGGLARASRSASSEQALKQAEQVDTATAEVEDSISALGLNRCEALDIALVERGAN